LRWVFCCWEEGRSKCTIKENVEQHTAWRRDYLCAGNNGLK
jgi:hypothetical protein